MAKHGFVRRTLVLMLVSSIPHTEVIDASIAFTAR
jgi:hypothetical protein